MDTNGNGAAGGAEKASEDIMEQLRKVMRLARRAATDGEKAAAESAAKRIAEKHGIDLKDIEHTDSDIKSEATLDEEWRTWPGTEIGYVTSVLRQHFGVILVQQRRGNKVRFQWIGTKINIEIAKHVTVILLRFCQRDWKSARTAKAFAKKLVNAPVYHDPQKQRALVELVNLNKRAFLDGWFWTIHQKLRENPLRNDREQFEAEKKAAEEMLKKMENIDDKQGQSKMSELDRKSVMMGYEAAKEVNLSRPCSGRENSRFQISNFKG